MSVRLSLRLTRRELPQPAANARSRWLFREACIITLQSDDGPSGSGEAAPLPAYSPDALTDVVRALSALDPSGLPERLEPGASVFVTLANASARLPRALPAARAALESALLDLWAHAAQVPAWALLSGDSTPPRARRVAALLMGEPEQALEQAHAAHARGVRAFKMKVGRAAALDRELGAFAGLRAALGPTAALRLDANREWSVAAAPHALRRFAEFAPEFVEEPCAPSGFTGLAECGVPLALDESLSELTPESSALAELARRGVGAVILKPTLLGGLSACAAWARAARACGAEVILSHAFEGPLGLAACAALALSLGSERSAHGLDLEGARLDRAGSPCFSGSEIEPWAAPGFGPLELGP